MNRRTTLMLTGMTLGLAIAAVPQIAFAQSDPFLGTWQLNLAKSKFSPGPPPRSVTVNEQAEGQNLKGTFTGTDTSGNPINFVAAYVFDGMPHPTGNPNGDATAYTRVDALHCDPQPYQGRKVGRDPDPCGVPGRQDADDHHERHRCERTAVQQHHGQ
jgi:hypothetical protein